MTIVEPPALAAPRFENGTFRVNLIGLPGSTNLIETSNNLASWTPLATVTNLNRAASFSVPPTVGASTSYYRARVP